MCDDDEMPVPRGGSGARQHGSSIERNLAIREAADFGANVLLELVALPGHAHDIFASRTRTRINEPGYCLMVTLRSARRQSLRRRGTSISASRVVLLPRRSSALPSHATLDPDLGPSLPGSSEGRRTRPLAESRAAVRAQIGPGSPWARERAACFFFIAAKAQSKMRKASLTQVMRRSCAVQIRNFPNHNRLTIKLEVGERGCGADFRKGSIEGGSIARWRSSASCSPLITKDATTDGAPRSPASCGNGPSRKGRSPAFSQGPPALASRSPGFLRSRPSDSARLPAFRTVLPSRPGR